MTEAARRLGMEVFASIRMNDTHDAFGKPHGRLDYPLKLEHPEWLLGDESRKGDFKTAPEALMWSGLDFEVPQVREDRLGWIRRSAETYDVDGVDLNFFRMPWFFRRGREAEGTPLMTDLVRDARRVLDEVSERKGTPVLLGVRVPGTVETCARVGIDIETWLREDLVDRLLVGGGYEPYSSPYEELVRLGHDRDVPVYPCINCGLPELGSDAAFRGAASNIYHAGGDGIYLWNYQYRHAPSIGYGRPQPAVYELLRELASPQALARGDKLFGVENVDRVGPYAIASHPTQLPHRPWQPRPADRQVAPAPRRRRPGRGPPRRQAGQGRAHARLPRRPARRLHRSPGQRRKPPAARGPRRSAGHRRRLHSGALEGPRRCRPPGRQHPHHVDRRAVPAGARHNYT